MNAVQFSKYILARLAFNGDLITNKKLQKLIYYMQSWHLVYFDTPLFEEDFQAWVHGPVVPELYTEYNKFHSRPIDISFTEGQNYSKDADLKKVIDIYETSYLSPDKVELIDAVFSKYGKLTAWELEMLSHSETPWIEARKGLAPHQPGQNVIEKNTMKDYYSSLIKE